MESLKSGPIRIPFPDVDMAEQKTEEAIYSRLYGGQDIRSTEAELHKLTVPGICGKVIEKNGMAWRCLDCLEYPTSFICKECFMNSDHTNHSAKLLRVTGGGTCDCGDPEAWKSSGSCPLHAAGFSDERTITPEKLPESMRASAVSTLDEVVHRLNVVCLQMEDLYRELRTGRPAPATFKSDCDEAAVIMYALTHLTKDVTPVFVHIVAPLFRRCPLDCRARHQCYVRRFASQEEEEEFREDCRRAGLRGEAATGVHTCTCNVIENLMRVHFMFREDVRKFINDNLLPTLMQNRRIKFYMALAYYSNYPNILPHDVYSSVSLCHLSSQFTGLKDAAQIVLQTEECVDKIFAQRVRIMDEVKRAMSEKRTITADLGSQMMHCCYDIDTLLSIQPQLFLPYIDRFITSLTNLHCIEITPATVSAITNQQELFDQINALVKYLSRDFDSLLGSGDLTDPAFSKRIAHAILSAFRIIKEHDVFTKLSHHIIMVHRFTSVFLTNYLVLNMWGKGLIKDGDTATKQREVVTTLLRELFGFQNDVELYRFVEDTLKELLLSIGLFIRSQTTELVASYKIVRTTTQTVPTDFGLVVILLSAMEKREDLLAWLVRGMHPTSKGVRFVLDRLADGKLNSEVWTEAAKLDWKKSEEFQQIFEHTLYTICGWAANETFFHEPLAMLRDTLPERIATEVKERMDQYFNYCTMVFIVQLYMVKKGRSGLSSEFIQSEMPDVLRDSRRIEERLRKYGEAKVHRLENVSRFFLFNSGLSLFDPFCYTTRAKLTESEKEATNVMASIKSPKYFDYLLGEFARQKQPETSGLPFKQLVREKLYWGNVAEVVRRALSPDNVEFFSPDGVRCCIKLALSSWISEEGPDKSEEIKESLECGLRRLIPKETGEFLLSQYKKFLGYDDEFPDFTKELSGEAREKEKRARKSTYDQLQESMRSFGSVRMQSANTRLGSGPVVQLLCSQCHIPLSPSDFSKNPYGALTFVQHSTVYLQHMLQALLRKYPSVILPPEDAMKELGCGTAVSQCKHYMHEKCFRQLQRTHPTGTLDQRENPDYVMCTECYKCSNALLPPVELVRDPAAVRMVQEQVLTRLGVQSFDSSDDGLAGFSTISGYITYEMLAGDLLCCEDSPAEKRRQEGKGEEDKSEIFLTIIRGFIRLFHEKTSPGEGIALLREQLGNSLRFLHKRRHRLFETNLLHLYVQIVLAATLADCKEVHAEIYDEIRGKTVAILRLAMMQIAMKKLYDESKGWLLAHERLRETLCTHLDLRLSSAEPAMVTFMKKVLFLKKLLFPAAGQDPNSESRSEYMFAGLERRATQVYVLLENLDLLNFSAKSRSSYLPIPHIGKGWMQRCWSSLLRHSRFTEEKGCGKTLPRAFAVLEAAAVPAGLIDMAEDYNEMQKRYAGKECSVCKSVQGDTAVCLICGMLLCVANKSPAKKKQQENELSEHSKKCPGGFGMFFKFMNNKVLLVDSGQVCAYPSPYVNEQEESVDTEKNESYGKLVLSRKIADDLLYMYLSHSIKQNVRAMPLIMEQLSKRESLYQE